MSNDLNCCMFVGRLGADPETAYMPSGEPACRFRIAVGWKTKDKEGVEWVPVQCYGKLAEIAGQYLAKGKQVLVQGRLRTRKWQDQSGADRYSTEIVADKMQMLGSRQDGDQGGGRGGYDSGYEQPPQRQQGGQQQRQQGGQQRQQPPRQQQNSGGFGDFGDFDEDMPF